MHKIILTLLMTILFTPAANAQNCVNSSRCDELGYTKTTTDCAGLDTLVCPFDENKVFCVFSEKSCEVGDILYENKKCYVKAIDGKTAIGVVFNAAKRLAIAMEQIGPSWEQGRRYADIPTLENCSSATTGCAPSGKTNTAKIIAYGKENAIQYPAAEYCGSYSTAGTSEGDWFLPSPAELLLLSASYNTVNETFAILKIQNISPGGYYWSSSELNGSTAFALNPSSGAVTEGTKHLNSIVRCVLEF